MAINYERQWPAERAWEIAQATFKKLHLQANFSHYGSAIKTYHCQLIASNQSIFYGCGKGLGIQSQVSAAFEALEHYAVHNYCQINSKKHRHSLNDPHIRNTLKNLNLVDEKIFYQQAHIPFAVCHEMTSGQSLYYPLFLIDPRYAKNPAYGDTFNYQPYAWQACDSGIASGTSKEEAYIHALNESIERDAYSLFLIKTFLLHNTIPVIDKLTVPNYLQKLIQHIEKQYAEELILVDMTSDIGVPTILVTMTQQAMAIQPIGCGTSLYKEYALERALLESLQPLHIYNAHLADNQRQILQQLVDMPLLAQCAKADLLSLRNNFTCIDFNMLPSYTGARGLKHQLHTLVKRIKDQGFEIYTLAIADLACGFHCVKTIIPQFEQFYLVEIGKHVLPNARGRQLIQNSLTMKDFAKG